jgi:hypothetical protein
MIINNPHVVSVSVHPSEDHPPLVVDTDGVKRREVTPQPFKAILRRHQQVVDPAYGIKHFQLALGGACEALKLPDKAVAKQILGFSVAERLDHR